jgi:ssDNA-binding protein
MSSTPSKPLVTPVALLAYSSLVTPAPSKLDPSKPPKFFACLLFSETSVETPAFKQILAAIDELARNRFGPNYSRGKFGHPVRRDVDPSKGYPKDIAAFMNCSALGHQQLRLVDRDIQDLIDPAAEFYPGAQVRASLKLRPYGGPGTPYPANPGISCDLVNVQKWEDAPRLAIARGDGSEFGGLDSDDDIMS